MSDERKNGKNRRMRRLRFPSVSEVNTNYAVVLMAGHHYAESLAQFQKVLERDPNFPPAHFKLSQLYATTGRFAEAVAELQKIPSNHVAASPDAKGYRDLIRSKFRPEDADTSSAIAVASALGGDRDQAFQYLEKAYVDGDDELLWVIRFPAMDSLRADPRFADLLRSLGLSQ